MFGGLNPVNPQFCWSIYLSSQSVGPSPLRTVLQKTTWAFGKSRACATRATREPTREILWIGMEAAAQDSLFAKPMKLAAWDFFRGTGFLFGKLWCLYPPAIPYTGYISKRMAIQYATIHPENIVKMDFWSKPKKTNDHHVTLCVWFLSCMAPGTLPCWGLAEYFHLELLNSQGLCWGSGCCPCFTRNEMEEKWCE